MVGAAFSVLVAVVAGEGVVAAGVPEGTTLLKELGVADDTVALLGGVETGMLLVVLEPVAVALPEALGVALPETVSSPRPPPTMEKGNEYWYVFSGSSSQLSLMP